ncbi:MAG: hypothetical protein EOP84_14565 [Verrucomicrobiaceae bacterium]|nr:MAG: hypothetical protein EOP84_14565 [Verrucomicrobiaceae bacterium]
MKQIAFILFAALVMGPAMAPAQDSTETELPLQQLLDRGQLKGGTIETLPDKSLALKVENAGPDPLQKTLIILEQPGITTDFYKIVGEVRYENVAGDGFLEMWNHFGENAAFSRTLGEFGPMGKLRGTSDWRPFILPFNATGTTTRPSKLVINLHLPGKGVVYLKSLKLVQAKPGTAMIQTGDRWWSDRGAGWIGGIGGALIGCLGSFMEMRAQRGKSRAFVLWTCRILIGIGAAATGLGLLALLFKQPYGVWYVLLLMGVLCVVIFPFRLRRYQDLYRQVELRRMSALDAA